MWIIKDLIGILPYTLILSLIPMDWNERSSPGINVLRAVKLVNYMRVFRQFSNLDSIIKRKRKHSTVGIYKYFYIWFMFSHIMTCIWIAIELRDQTLDYEEKWL